MKRGFFIFRLLLVVVLAAVVVGMGVYVYNAGVAQGLLSSGSLPAPAAGAPAVVYAAPFIHPPLGFGFLGCLAPLLFLLFFFGLLRLLFWAGPGRHAFHHAGCGPGRRGMNWEKGVPPFFEEWHRRAHQPEPPAGEAPQAAE